MRKLIVCALGCLGSAFAITMMIGGMVHLGLKCLFNVDAGISLFVVVFLFVMALLIACVGLYSVNPSLWNKVHKEHEKGTGNTAMLFRLIPDIYLFVDLVNYVGGEMLNSIRAFVSVACEEDDNDDN